MIKVDIKKQGNYPISNISIRKHLQEFFAKNGIVSDAQVSVAIVSEAKMKEIGQTFLGESTDAPAHNVLSFVPSEATGDFAYPDDNILRLGEIIICYPVVFKEALEEGVSIEEKALSLLTHGGEHLLGRHHS